MTSLAAAPVSDGAFDRAEPLLERLDLAEDALTNLARLTATDEDRYRHAAHWAARVEVGGTPLLCHSDGDRWSIFAPQGADEAEATLAARRLHGLLGEIGEGWELDR